MRNQFIGKCLSLSGILLLGVTLGAQDAAVLTAALASGDYQKAEREVKALAKTEEGKNLAKPVLEARLAKTKAAFAVAVRGAEAPLAKLKDEGQVDAYLSLVEAWRKQADETMAFIMNPETYPAPSKMPFAPGDLQVNQAIVEGKVEATIALWNERELVLGGLLGIRAAGSKSPGGGNYASKVDKGKLKDPCEDIVPMLRYKFVDCSRGLERAIPKWRIAFRKYQAVRDELAAEVKLATMLDLDPGEPPKLDPLILAVHCLFSDKLEEAWEKAAELDKAHTGIFVTVGHRYLMLRNQKPDGDWTKNEIGALALLNQYRLSLGLNPLVGNKHVQQAAIDHSKYQAKAGMSHGESDPQRATPGQRVALTGYKGAGGTENCASTNDTIAAIWMWRMDSGHHKGLLARGRAVGLAGRGPATFNVGSTTEDPLLDRW